MATWTDAFYQRFDRAARVLASSGTDPRAVTGVSIRPDRNAEMGPLAPCEPEEAFATIRCAEGNGVLGRCRLTAKERSRRTHTRKYGETARTGVCISICISMRNSRCRFARRGVQGPKPGAGSQALLSFGMSGAIRFRTNFEMWNSTEAKRYSYEKAFSDASASNG